MKYEVISRPKSGYTYPKIISLDTEYSELNIRKAELLGIVVGVSTDKSYILESFKSVQRFIDEADIIFTWNGVVDWYILTKSGFNFPKSKIIDAMLLEHLIDERLPHGLGDFALRECNDDYKKKFWEENDSYQAASKEVAYEYEMRDGVYTFRAGCEYLQKLKGKELLIHHVHQLQWALFDTEIRGLKVNRELMLKTKLDMGDKISSYLEKLRGEYNEYCTVWELQEWSRQIQLRKSDKGKRGVPRPIFSFSSDTQLRWLVYQGLQCPVIEKTKKGSPKTDYDTLKKLSESEPRLTDLVDYKDIKGIYATFVVGMLERVEETDRIHPGFYINGTTTGRISHANPNMGNLPREGVIRNFFIPDMGNSIVGADYSQLEVVVEANLTEDKQLLKIILEGASKHDITAQGLGISRDEAKTLNFALQYGAGIHKVSKILGLSYGAAKDVFDRYWVLYSGVKKLKDETDKILAETNQVTNLFGRTRHFNPPTNEFEKAKNERMAYNHLIQGVGADMCNMATYRIYDIFQKTSTGRLWFSVHDEIVTEVQSEIAEIWKDGIVTIMESVNDFVRFKYPVSAKAYGPLDKWSKA